VFAAGTLEDVIIKANMSQVPVLSLGITVQSTVGLMLTVLKFK
jgi:hypothetical protein